MSRLLYVINKSHLLSKDRNNFFDKLLELIGDRQYIWCIGNTASMETVVDYGYDLYDIHPNLSGLVLHKEIGYCYFILGRNITGTGKVENAIHKTEKYNHQDINKLISEGIFISCDTLCNNFTSNIM